MYVSSGSSGVYFLYLDEVFDFKKIDEFRGAYEGIDATLCQEVDIDFSATKYIDSSALGMLLNIKKHFKDAGVKIKIVSASDQVKKILMISRFDQKFIIE
jgi:HptB-dependent secretion and biofilm anti anti-sigma factor